MQITSRVIASCKLVIRYLPHTYIICTGQIKYYQESISMIIRAFYTACISHKEKLRK